MLNNKNKKSIMETKQKSGVRYLEYASVLLVLAHLLLYGASWQMFRADSDAAHYQCYAVAFWQGWSGLHKLPPKQCAFITHPDEHLRIVSQGELLHSMQQQRLPSGLIQFVAGQSPDQAYHTLPREYPWPMLLPYSLGLVAPAHWYQVAFAIWMLVLAGCL